MPVSRPFIINSENVQINSGNENTPAILESSNTAELQIIGDIYTDSIANSGFVEYIGFDTATDTIEIRKAVDFNGVAITNFTGGGGGGDYPRAILADSADFKDADATATSPRVVINKAGIDLYNENFPSTIVFENGTDGIRISRDTTTNYLKIEKNNTALSGLNIVDGDLQFGGVQISTSNLSDDFTIVNTSANNQSKVGELTIGDSGANCVVKKGIFKIHNEADNGAIEFSATGGNTRAFIQQNITDNNIDVFGGSGISMDFNLKSNDTVQPKLLYDGVTPSLSDWGGYDNVVTKNVTQTITGLKTFTADVKVNQLEITGYGNNIEILNTVVNGNLVFRPTTTILTNLDLHPNLNNVQGELLYNNAKPLLSSWGGYATFVDTLVDKTTAQSISGVKTFTTRQITGEGTGIQYGTNNNNHISAVANVMTLDCGNTMDFKAGTATKFVVDSNNVTILGDTSGIGYYHGSTLNEELMNKATTSALIQTTLVSDGILTFLKDNIIEGGYNGATGTSYPTEFKNSITFNEVGETYNPATNAWTTTGTANNLNINSNTIVSNTKDIVRDGVNYLDAIKKMLTTYRFDDSFAVAGGAETIVFMTDATLFSTFLNDVNTNVSTITLPQGLYKCQIVFSSDLGDRGAPSGYYNTLRGSFDINLAFPVDPDVNETDFNVDIPVSWSMHAAGGNISSMPTIQFVTQANGSYQFGIGLPSGMTAEAVNSFRLKMTHISNYPVDAI
jgi:hypothetical protein